MAFELRDQNEPFLALEQLPDAAHGALEDFFASRRRELSHIGAPVTQAIDYLERFVLDGGKRIRPLYLWAGFCGAQATGLTASSGAGEDHDAVIRAAASLELIQACALIHDDILDASETRRGKPAVHRQVADTHDAQGLLGDAGHFGTSVAILLGDMALAWADDMFRESGISPQALLRAQQPWHHMRQEVIGGQMLDISIEAHADESRTLAANVNRFKTAAYTIERPLHLGAAIGGGSEELITAFRGYGRDIGIAFQLRDDLLGVFGDPEVTGKPAGDDLREGKRTELIALTLSRADERDPHAAADLRRLLGTTSDPADINRMREIITASGAVDEIERDIDQLRESGLAQLRAVSLRDDVRANLESLAIKATRRHS
ncbi:polyprenyl synthetase family protein [Corynebacterium propinquum]|uniref:polyprenyl synthetase family protein n=1 Tax=Corynebacterium propinquum TaxID=43769 RepID=UPI0003647EE4|nr:polyprenyl synthetase family protein [Corynebacterium propinquum]MDK4238304.1 polyprenyl synthetase family protein [Corynebacterium propinquum]MDK4257344.1 polyprenyl synthetase family protein [Corynebacterium propinquum]MDK4282692.1 polyprenyl synthetase family protein [Corynebacterium propinquum]MDK4299139.1 polyprenyl synthetase family protein [Corynebacterium propinquum]MDK8535057.1 polyprenyl synthetase family protein [Corynebacterium propinquum]